MPWPSNLAQTYLIPYIYKWVPATAQRLLREKANQTKQNKKVCVWVGGGTDNDEGRTRSPSSCFWCSGYIPCYLLGYATLNPLFSPITITHLRILNF